MMNYRLFEAVLRKIYQDYNPEKESNVDSLLAKYKGRKRELLQGLCDKYDISDETIERYKQEYVSASKKANRQYWICIFCIVGVAILILAILSLLEPNKS